MTDLTLDYLKARADFLVKRSEVSDGLKATRAWLDHLSNHVYHTKSVNTSTPVPDLATLQISIVACLSLEADAERLWQALPNKNSIKSPWEE